MEDCEMELRRLQGTVSAAALLPLRLFLGVTFLYAGLDKLLDPSFFDPASPSGIRAQLEGFTHVSPLAPLIQAVALPFPVAIGVLMALGEIAVGLGALTGLAYRLAAAGGAVISFTLLLTASWTVRPFYLGNDLPYLLGWVTLALAGSGEVLVLGPWLERKLGLRRPAPAGQPGGPGAEEVASPGRRLFLGAAVLGALTLVVGAVAGGLRMLLPASTTTGNIATPVPADQRSGRCTHPGTLGGERHHPEPARRHVCPGWLFLGGQRNRERERFRLDVRHRLHRAVLRRSRGGHQALRRDVRGL
jgi:thiosulfate dehydrogenase [quinone] large subunit